MSPAQRVMFMVCLVVAGEAIFGLPFHVARFFRPTLLEVFGFTNTELGAVMAVYGVTAMIAYFPGGPLADLFPARRLLALSLLATALGGLFFLTIPSYTGMSILFGFWGVTTILLFWAALIRATRDWGSEDEQGKAYGILDGGRGVLAAAIAVIAVWIFQTMLPADPSTATDAERLLALRGIITAYIITTFLAAVLVWFFVPEGASQNSEKPSSGLNWDHVAKVLKYPAVWLQAVIVVCAYVAYKGLDNYSLFAVQAWGMNEVEGAKVTAWSAWIRPIAAIGAGMLGDKFKSSRIIVVGFIILLCSDLFFGLTNPNPSATWILFANVMIACVAIYGMRGVYFALFEEASVPRAFTGTAVGLVSVIGYTPDVFVGLTAGYLLDRSPGVAGHQHFFLFMAGFAAVGLVATLLFQRIVKNL
jgi:sugar phosphate permease